jgi:tRNA G26 N,N-dimethylase Trm1
MALRIVLQCIEAHANRYGRYIVPLLSLSIDFYVRIFVRVYSSQKQCKKTTSKLGNVYQCTGCETINVQPLGVLIPGEDDSKNIKVLIYMWYLIRYKKYLPSAPCRVKALNI